MAQEKPGQTLQATALVHEAYMRLVDVEKAQHWNSRGHFFGAAAEAMRRILVDACPSTETAEIRGGDGRRDSIWTWLTCYPIRSRRIARSWTKLCETGGRGSARRPSWSKLRYLCRSQRRRGSRSSRDSRRNCLSTLGFRSRVAPFTDSVRATDRHGKLIRSFLETVRDLSTARSRTDYSGTIVIRRPSWPDTDQDIRAIFLRGSGENQPEAVADYLDEACGGRRRSA